MKFFSRILIVIFCLSVCASVSEVQAKSPFKSIGKSLKSVTSLAKGKMPKPLKTLISVLVDTPHKVTNFSNYSLNMSKKIFSIQRTILTQRLTKDELHKLLMDLEEFIDQSADKIDDIVADKVFINLHVANLFCSTPPLQNLSSIPYIGNALTAIVTRVAITDSKVGVMTEHATWLLSYAIQLSHQIRLRLDDMDDDAAKNKGEQ